MIRPRVLAATAAAVTLVGVTALPAEAAVTGTGGSTAACSEDSSKFNTLAVTVKAPTEEELESQDAKLVKVEADNPCAQTFAIYLGVTKKRTGERLDYAFNIRPGSHVVLRHRDLVRYGIIGGKVTFNNSYGSGNSAAVSGNGVVVVATL